VLGASGAVGREAVRELRNLGYRGLRLGGRTGRALDALIEPGAGDEAHIVDVRDPSSLASFAKSCDLVVNCVGPAYELRATVPAAALEAGAHCVDVGGDDPAMEDLTAPEAPRHKEPRSLVLSAGVLPGLSSILPAWLANQGLDSVRSLVGYCGGLEPCSPTVAQDVLLSLLVGGADGAAYGESLAAWRGGRRRSQALRIVQDAPAPGFPDRVALQPYLSFETQRLAARLGLESADWYNVYPGSRIRTLFGRLPGRLAEGADRARLAEQMMLAARLDLVGRTPYYAMDFALSGTGDGVPVTRRLTLRAPSSYRLTGMVAAWTGQAVLDGSVAPGVHYACDVLDPEAVVRRLRASDAVERFELDQGTDTSHEEGSL